MVPEPVWGTPEELARRAVSDPNRPPHCGLSGQKGHFLQLPNHIPVYPQVQILHRHLLSRGPPGPGGLREADRLPARRGRREPDLHHPLPCHHRTAQCLSHWHLLLLRPLAEHLSERHRDLHPGQRHRLPRAAPDLPEAPVLLLHRPPECPECPGHSSAALEEEADAGSMEAAGPEAAGPEGPRPTHDQPRAAPGRIPLHGPAAPRHRGLRLHAEQGQQPTLQPELSLPGETAQV